MGQFAPLPLKSHDGRPLPHTFLEANGAGLLMVLPGLHYGPEGPVHYLLTKRMQASGWDTLGLTYGFQASMSFPWTDHAAETISESAAAVREAMTHRAYPHLAIVGKSLGSIILVQLSSQNVVPPEARLAYLTPPLGNAMFDDPFASTPQPAYIAIGTADGFYSEQAVAELRARRPALVRVVKDADHGLDVPSDLAASLRVLGQVVEDMTAFFLTGEIPGFEGPANR